MFEKRKRKLSGIVRINSGDGVRSSSSSSSKGNSNTDDLSYYDNNPEYEVFISECNKPLNK